MFDDRRRPLPSLPNALTLFSFRKVIHHVAWPSAIRPNAVIALWLPALAPLPALDGIVSQECNSLSSERAWRWFISTVSCGSKIKHFKQRTDKRGGREQWWMPTSLLADMLPSQTRTSALRVKRSLISWYFCNKLFTVVWLSLFSRKMLLKWKSLPSFHLRLYWLSESLTGQPDNKHSARKTLASV